MNCSGLTQILYKLHSFHTAMEVFLRAGEVENILLTKQQIEEETAKIEFLQWKSLRLEQTIEMLMDAENIAAWRHFWPVKVSRDGSKILILNGENGLKLIDLKTGENEQYEMPLHNESGKYYEVGDCFDISADNKRILVKGTISDDIGEMRDKKMLTISVGHYDKMARVPIFRWFDRLDYDQFVFADERDNLLLVENRLERSKFGDYRKTEIFRSESDGSKVPVGESRRINSVEGIVYQPRSGLIAVKEKNSAIHFFKPGNEDHDTFREGKKAVIYRDSFMWLSGDQNISIYNPEDHFGSLVKYSITRDVLGKDWWDEDTDPFIMERFTNMAISSDESVLLLAKDDGKISVVNTFTWKKINEIDLSNDLAGQSVRSMDITPDGKLIIGLIDGRILVYSKSQEGGGE